jgi:hypothetical protein
MSLGPCGEYTGLTSKGVLMLSIIQVPLMLSVVFGRPAVNVDIFSSKVVVVLDELTNTTAINLNHPTELHYMHSMSIATFFIICSALICFFSVMTYQIETQGHYH